ncbi:hypothetical protein X773_25795 [Mesorhizobium sp. LSJC285A00]|uniref:hypothetical protein n=1 Tax=Mesorhizobium sp. M0015 TaxID=2956842 RepID=UPI0003CE21DD|nr:hypothetical protein X773_25795 [Mesorhizobium sp. LSJC285A00]
MRGNTGPVPAHNLAPALVEIGVAFGGNRFVLLLPEQVGIGEIAVLAEQVRGDQAGILLDGKQCHLGGNRLAAEQPLLQLIATRRVLIGIGTECQPVLLLRLGRHGEMAHRLGVDLLAPIGFADFGQEVAKRQNAFDLEISDAEGHSDVENGAALPDKPRNVSHCHTSSGSRRARFSIRKLRAHRRRHRPP